MLQIFGPVGLHSFRQKNRIYWFNCLTCLQMLYISVYKDTNSINDNVLPFVFSHLPSLYKGHDSYANLRHSICRIGVPLFNMFICLCSAKMLDYGIKIDEESELQHAVKEKNIL